MKTLVLIDRDGTLIYDDKYHLGKTNDWKKKVKILPTVTKGLKLLKVLPEVHTYIITNQPGVAVKDFKLLTEERSRKVCKYIQEKLNKLGANIEGHFVCPHASPAYTNKRSNYKFNKKLVCNCSCIKPKLGMVFDVLKLEGITKKNTNIYIIGDRASDIKTAHNIKGTGILIPFKGEPGQVEAINKLRGKTYVASNFLDAAKYIQNEIHKRK